MQHAWEKEYAIQSTSFGRWVAGGIFALLCAALAAVPIAPAHPVTRSLDLLGSVVMSVHLLWRGLRASHKHFKARQNLDETAHRHAS